MKATIQPDSSKQPLTEKQHDFLLFLQDYIEKQGFPPTMKEIGDKFSFASTNAVTQYLVALERKGYIRRTTKGASRGIQVIDFVPKSKQDAQNKALTTPLALSPSVSKAIAPMLNHQFQSVKNVVIVGDGTAQNPLSAFLSPRGQIKIDTDFFLAESLLPSSFGSPSVPSLASSSNSSEGAPVQLFAAIVSDDAMNADGLREGDVVVARQQFNASNGDVVVAIFHDTLLVRRYSSLAGVSELTATVNAFPPIPFHEGAGIVAIIGVVIGQMRRF